MKDWKKDYSHMVGGVPFYPINKVEDIIDQTREETINNLNVGFLRQWLNEERITDKPLVSNEDIMNFIKPFNK